MHLRSEGLREAEDELNEPFACRLMLVWALNEEMFGKRGIRF